MASVKIAEYDEIKALPNHPEKVLIDVRNPDELKETGQIPTSINIPVAQLEEQLNLSDADFQAKYKRPKPKAEDEVIFHCKMGGRAKRAADAAVALGFLNVKNYKGSWTDWAQRENL